MHKNKIINTFILSNFLTKKRKNNRFNSFFLDKNKTFNIEISNDLFLIDISLAKFFAEEKTNSHFEFKSNEN